MGGQLFQDFNRVYRLDERMHTMIEVLKRRWAGTGERRKSGQALVEFALVFPLFIVILFTIIDFGWMAYQKAAFDYSRIHASWDYAGLDVNNPTSSTFDWRYGSSSDPSVRKKYTIGVPAAVRASIEKAPSIGFDPSQLNVNSASVTMWNVPSESSVPDRLGEPTRATKLTRKAKLEATVTYRIKPIIGLLIQPVDVTEQINVTHTVGDQTRTY